VLLQLKKSDRRVIDIGLVCEDRVGRRGGRVGQGERRDGFTCSDEGHVAVRMLQARLNFVNCVK